MAFRRPTTAAVTVAKPNLKRFALGSIRNQQTVGSIFGLCGNIPLAGGASQALHLRHRLIRSRFSHRLLGDFQQAVPGGQGFVLHRVSQRTLHNRRETNAPYDVPSDRCIMR